MSCFEEFWNFHDFKTFCPVECPALRPFVMLWDLLSCQMSCFEEFWSFYDFETFCPAECPALNKFLPFILLDVLFSEASISFSPFVMLTYNTSIKRNILVKNQTQGSQVGQGQPYS